MHRFLDYLRFVLYKKATCIGKDLISDNNDNWTELTLKIVKSFLFFFFFFFLDFKSQQRYVTKHDDLFY